MRYIHLPRKRWSIGCLILSIVFSLLFLAGWYMVRKDILRYRVRNGCLTVDRRADKPDTYYGVFDSDNFRIRHGLTFGGRSIERPDPIHLTLRVPFEVVGKSKLVIAEPNEGGHGFPAEAFRRLIVLPPKSRATELFVIRDLRGRAKIRTPEEALAFCRLLTSPATFYYLDAPGVEVASKDKIGIDFFFGDKQTFSFHCGSKCEGMMGLVDSKSDLDSLGIRPAAVRKIAGGYEVRRTLLVEQETWFSYKFEDVIETVGVNGSYNCVTLRERSVPKRGKYSFMIFHPM